MSADFWQKQGEEPLFPDLLWSKPENRQQAGKLLIIGGNLHGFAAPANAYREAVGAGIGVARVLLPDALQKTVGKFVENAEYAPSTPSGSFNQAALAEWMEQAAWADAALLAGDLGRNSETAIVLERFAAKAAAPLVITKDAVDYFTSDPAAILKRPQTTLVLSIAQLQKLATQAHWPTAITFSMGMVHLVDFLHEFTLEKSCNIIVKHLDVVYVAVGGQVSTTPTDNDEDIWRVPTAAHAAVWWLQNPNKPFEALTSAALSTLT